MSDLPAAFAREEMGLVKPGEDVPVPHSPTITAATREQVITSQIHPQELEMGLLLHSSYSAGPSRGRQATTASPSGALSLKTPEASPGRGGSSNPTPLSPRIELPPLSTGRTSFDTGCFSLASSRPPPRERVWFFNFPRISGARDEQSFWDMCATMMHEYDEEKIDKWTKRLSNVALIAGLMIAAIMGFWQGTATGSGGSLPDGTTQQDGAPQNIWEISLYMLLLAVVISVPSYHVIDRYTLNLPVPLPERVRERQRRNDGLMRSGLPVVIIILELFVSLASLILLAGIAVYHDTSLRWVATGVGAFALIVSTYLTLFPIAETNWSVIPYSSKTIARDVMASIRYMRNPSTDGVHLKSDNHNEAPRASELQIKNMRNMKVAVWVANHTMSPYEREASLRSAHTFGPIPQGYFKMFRSDLHTLSIAAIRHCVEKTDQTVLKGKTPEFRRERIRHLAAYSAWVQPRPLKSIMGFEGSYELREASLEDFTQCVKKAPAYTQDSDADDDSTYEHSLLAYSLVLRGNVSKSEVTAFDSGRWIDKAILELKEVLRSDRKIPVFSVCLLLDTFVAIRKAPSDDSHLTPQQDKDLRDLVIDFLDSTFDVPAPVLQCCLAILVFDIAKGDMHKKGLTPTHALLWTENPVHTLVSLLKKDSTPESNYWPNIFRWIANSPATFHSKPTICEPCLASLRKTLRWMHERLRPMWHGQHAIWDELTCNLKAIERNFDPATPADTTKGAELVNP